MQTSGQIALGRVVIGARERLLALEPQNQGILAHTLRADAEVRKPDEIFGAISDAKPDPGMIAIAEKIIEQKQGPFDPSKFVDRYEEALKAMIEDKTKGRKPAKVSEPEDTNVVDLMAALRASLGGKADSGAKAPAKSSASKPRRRKPS
jgi:DNA end-binding protein Ku